MRPLPLHDKPGYLHKNRLSWHVSTRSACRCFVAGRSNPKRKLGNVVQKGSGTVAGTAGHRPKVGRVLRTTVPDLFLNHAAECVSRNFKSLLMGLVTTAAPTAEHV